MTITRVLSKKKGEEDVSVGGLSISFFLLSWETNISIRKLRMASGFPSLQFFFRHNVQCAGFIASFFTPLHSFFVHAANYFPIAARSKEKEDAPDGHRGL